LRIEKNSLEKKFWNFGDDQDVIQLRKIMAIVKVTTVTSSQVGDVIFSISRMVKLYSAKTLPALLNVIESTSVFKLKISTNFVILTSCRLALLLMLKFGIMKA